MFNSDNSAKKKNSDSFDPHQVWSDPILLNPIHYQVRGSERSLCALYQCSTNQSTKTMSLLSLTCAQSIYFSTSPPQHLPTKFKNFPFPSTSSTRAATLKFSPFSQKLLGNGNWVSHRNRFHAKSADSEPNANQPSAQVSQENGTVSNSSGNPSTSFLSILCPLLKLFSVSLLILPSSFF